MKHSLWYCRKTKFIRSPSQTKVKYSFFSFKHFFFSSCSMRSCSWMSKKESCRNLEMLKGPTRSSDWKVVKLCMFKAFFSIVFLKAALRVPCFCIFLKGALQESSVHTSTCQIHYWMCSPKTKNNKDFKEMYCSSWLCIVWNCLSFFGFIVFFRVLEAFLFVSISRAFLFCGCEWLFATPPLIL